MADPNSDRLWREQAIEYGWKLPRKAPWPLCLPGIRFIRAAWSLSRIEKHAHAYGCVGIGLGQPNPYDKWVVYAIYRGWA